MNTEDLIVSAITVDEGPVMKRYMPRAMGRATIIRKKTCHINVTLEDRPIKNKLSKKMEKSAKVETKTQDSTEAKEDAQKTESQK